MSFEERGSRLELSEGITIWTVVENWLWKWNLDGPRRNSLYQDQLGKTIATGHTQPEVVCAEGIVGDTARVFDEMVGDSRMVVEEEQKD